MTITVREEHGIALVHLGDSENTFTQSAINTLIDALDALERSNSDAPVVTIAEGKFWSNGFDLDWVRDESCREETIAAGHALLARVLTLGRPSVAVIQGHAFGLGAMLALAHDYQVMRQDRGFLCLPEVDLGLNFPAGMRALLTTKLPHSVVLDALAFGHRFGGEEAEQKGIVHRAVAEAELLDTALELVNQRRGKNPQALSQIKYSVYREVLTQLGTTTA